MASASRSKAVIAAGSGSAPAHISVAVPAAVESDHLDAPLSTAVPPATPTRPASLYRRTLPPSCIPFTSPEGKALFAKTLPSGTLDSFFPLSSQFLTQNEPTYCGLGTLCMILNALGVDPQRTWKGVWRWFEQDMLDCCRPLSAVLEEGLTLAEFCCLARCNGVQVAASCPPPQPTPAERDEGIAKLRRDLKRATTSGSEFMAVAYSRRTLGQTGDGHFSPVGGYSEAEDAVLILDVARFKYPSYWIKVPLLYDALLPLDSTTKQPRGYALLSLLPPAPQETCSNPGNVTLTSLMLHKASWASLSRSLSAAVLSLPRSVSPSDLVSAIAKAVDARPTPPIALRAGSFLTSAFSTVTTRVHQDPFHALFILALFSPKDGSGPLSPVMDPDMEARMAQWTSEALGGVERVVTYEVEGLRRQVLALGECCRDEGMPCSCASRDGPPERTC